MKQSYPVHDNFRIGSRIPMKSLTRATKKDAICLRWKFAILIALKYKEFKVKSAFILLVLLQILHLLRILTKTNHSGFANVIILRGFGCTTTLFHHKETQ
jgi:hypothetical protein